MKLAYKIMGVPRRMENINKLKQELNLNDDDVFLDVEYKKNPMWTWKKTATLPMDEDVTHVVIIQDDAILCNRFKEFCERMAERFPKDIFSLFNMKCRSIPIPMYSIYKEVGCAGGVCAIIPREYIKGIIEFQERHYPTSVNDDNMLVIWSERNKVNLWNTYPSVTSTSVGESYMEHTLGAPRLVEQDPCEHEWNLLDRNKY